MPSSIITDLSYFNTQINIYLGIFILIAGTIGNLLNLLVFLSLQTFRQSSCAFYLLIMSIANIGQLYTGALSRTMISGYSIDWTTTSLFYCKFRLLFLQFSSLVSYSCLCLATIDQFFATSSRVRWQQWCNLKLAQRLTAAITFIWMLHTIPYAILFQQVTSSTTNKTSCVASDTVFARYRAYFVGLFLTGFIPVMVTVVFGLLAFHNVHQLAYRTVPLVRRELDKQLTTMVLVQVLVNVLTDVPFVICNALTINPGITDDPVVWAKLQFALGVTLSVFYSYYAVSEDITKNE